MIWITGRDILKGGRHPGSGRRCDALISIGGIVLLCLLSWLATIAVLYGVFILLKSAIESVF